MSLNGNTENVKQKLINLLYKYVSNCFSVGGKNRTINERDQYETSHMVDKR